MKKIFRKSKELFNLFLKLNFTAKSMVPNLCVFITKEAKTYSHVDAKHTFTFVLPNYSIYKKTFISNFHFGKNVLSVRSALKNIS